MNKFMKKNLLLILTVLLLLSCGKNEKKTDLILGTSSLSNLAPIGKISFYSGKVSNGSATIRYSQNAKYSTSGPAIESYIYIKSIEISTTGEEWIKIVEGPIEVRVKDGETIRISTSTSIPIGEYHGVRLIINPEIKFSVVKWEEAPNQQVTVTLNKLPTIMRINRGGSYNNIVVTDTIMLTSANGFLVPFNIEENKETFFIFEFNVNWVGDNIDNISDWELNIAARATRFLY
ncbi:MAG: hypothetical protein PHE88_06440 [Elusimicrobia bacterium]|nr:hypothetical protein [Elusimicrobiota bacterium]